MSKVPIEGNSYTFWTLLSNIYVGFMYMLEITLFSYSTKTCLSRFYKSLYLVYRCITCHHWLCIGTKKIENAENKLSHMVGELQRKLWNQILWAISIGRRSKALPCLFGRQKSHCFYRPSGSVALSENKRDLKHRKTGKVDTDALSLRQYKPEPYILTANKSTTSTQTDTHLVDFIPAALICQLKIKEPKIS